VRPDREGHDYVVIEDKKDPVFLCHPEVKNLVAMPKKPL
jgi:hypothetical protein